MLRRHYGIVHDSYVAIIALISGGLTRKGSRAIPSATSTGLDPGCVVADGRTVTLGAKGSSVTSPVASVSGMIEHEDVEISAGSTVVTVDGRW